jgi:hypothetical protein
MDDLQFAAAYVTHRGMEHTRSYIERGRSLATMPVASLQTTWVNAFRAAYNHGGENQMRQMRDAAAELGLRKIQQPLGLVQDLIPAILERMFSMDDEMALSSFLKELEKPPN